MTPIYGIDFTSSPRKAKPITVARGRLAKNVFELEGIESLHDWAQFESFLQRPGPWVGGFDFPFGLPRELVTHLGWPTDWAACMDRYASLTRPALREWFEKAAGARIDWAKLVPKRDVPVAVAAPESEP